MSERMSADAIGVENRLDKVVLVVDEEGVLLRAAPACELALALQQGADGAQQTGS